MYLPFSTGIVIKNSVVQYNLPKHAVVINGTLQKIVMSSCTACGMNNYLCSAELHTRDIYCIINCLN